MHLPRVLPIVALCMVLAFVATVTRAQAPAQRQGNTYTLILTPDLERAATGADAPPAPTSGHGTLQFIGTATVLIRFQGFTILTDPNFLHKGDRVRFGGVNAERLTNPALELAQLPPVDLVILSNLHGDHFDQLVQAKLGKDIPIATTRQAAEKLKELGFTRTAALAPWDSIDVRKGEARLRVTSTPARHGRPGTNMLMPKVMGSVLDFGTKPGAPDYRIYISGDTLVYNDINMIPQRFPGIDLALLHLGGTRVMGVFKSTMDGKDGVQMLQIIQPDKAIPIHYDDYDVFKSPLADFANAVKEAGLDSKVVYLKHGETYSFTPAKR